MTLKSVCCDRAVENLGRAVALHRQFPSNVFEDAWQAFFFFDSDWIFHPDFLGVLRTLLNLEGATCACLADLDMALGEAHARQICIDYQTTDESYALILRGTTPGEGWIHELGRFGCISDVAGWCIYCERVNEIAVIAVKASASLNEYTPALTRLGAVRIQTAICQPPSYGFSAQAMSGQWCEELLRQYGTSVG